MKKNEQTFELKIRAVLDGMDKVVQELNRGLKEGTTKIDMSKGVGKNLTKQIENFREEYGKLADLTKGDKFEFADTKEVLRSGEAIIKSFKEIKRLVGDFGELALFDAKKLFPDAFNSQVEETRERFESLRRSLIDLNDKKIRLDEATNELNELKVQQEGLLRALGEQRSVVIDTQGAQQELDGAIEKVQTLKNELRETIGKNLSSVETSSANLEAEREQIVMARQARGAVEPTMTAKAATRAKLPQEQIDAISLYEREQARLKEIGAELEQNSKKAKKFRDALLADPEKTSLNDLAKTAEVSTEKINEVTDASKKLAEAQDNQKKTKSQFDAQTAAIKKTEAEYEALTGQVEKQEDEVKKLQVSYDNLKDKINPDDLKRAFSELNIDFSEDMVRDEQAVEELRKKLNQLEQQDLDKLIASLKQMGVSVDNTEELVKQLKSAFGGAKTAVEDFTETQREIDRLKSSIMEFFSITNTISLLKRTVNSATESIKALDAVMTEAAVVTDFSIGDMWDQMPQYSKNASELGVATKDLYSATTLYYQQGLKGNEVLAVGAETMKMAKIASMDAEEATQAMTAALRGFNMQVNELNAQKVNDVYSKLAAITAADTSQIATAMSKTASIAASANMEFETTAAFLAQIIETTQEAPETAGTALKTIIARFSEVKKLQNQGLMSGIDAEGEAIDINKISTALRSVGISMDAFFAGQEGLDDVLMRLSQKWDALDFKTQHYIATTAAGSRQQSRFMAMMSNYGRTMELVGEANDSAGASQEQYEKTLESLDSKLTQLKNAWEQFTMGLANHEVLKAGVDALTWILETVNKLTDAISGGNGLMKSITSLMTVIGALKLGAKVLGKNAGTDGLLGKIGGKLGIKDNSKQEYQRGVKDGYAYGKGQIAGYNKATKNIPAPEFIEETEGGLQNINKQVDYLSVGTLAAAGAVGLLGQAFENAGMEDAATAANAIATTLSVIGSALPAITKLFPALGEKIAAAATAASVSLGAVIGWAALATAVVAGLAALIAVVVKKQKEKSLEYRLEKATEAAEKSKTAADEAKAAYDDLLNQKNSYSEMQEALENLTKGTQEWKAALFQANQEVLALIEKYPELQALGYIGTDSNGRMTISNKGWAYMEEKTLEASKSASVAYAGAKLTEIDLTHQQENQSFYNMQDTLQGFYDTQKQYEEEIAEYEKLLAIAETLPDTNRAKEGYINTYNSEIKTLKKYIEDLQPYIKDWQTAVDAYQPTLDVQEGEKAAWVQGLINFTSDGTQKSEHFGKVTSAVATMNASQSADKIADYQDKYDESVMSDSAVDDLYEQYFGKAPKDMGREQKEQALASRDYGLELSKKTDNITQAIEGIESETQQRIVAAAISGDTSGLTMGELTELQGMSYNDIAKLLKYDELGDFQELTGLTQEQSSEFQSDFKTMYGDLVNDEIGKNAYESNKDFFEQSSIESVQKIAGFLKQGKIKGAQTDILIDAMVEALQDDDLEEGQSAILQNLLTSADWLDPLKSMDIMDTMLSMGIDQDTIQKYWKAATAGVQSYVDTETEALQLAGRMQGKIKNLGDLSNRMAEGTLTVDDMVMLEKAGVDTSNYKLTAEGWQATSEEIAKATDKMREFYLMQAKEQKDEIIREMVLSSTSEERKAELQDTLDIVKKTIEMLEQPITTTYKVETHIVLLDRIKEAIVFDRQKEIDKLSEINDTIADSNSRIVTAMRESVEDSRRMRENERTEQEIADKQARLSYLKMDTSGANAMEIKQLEEEIAQDQESYTDRLIDEKISALEEQNNIAQEQRAQQIELMQLQLEQANATGAFWGQVNELFNAAYNSETGELDENSEAVRLLQQAEGYQGLSAEAQQQWKDDLLSAFKEGVKVEVKVEFTGRGAGAVSSGDLGAGPGLSKVVAVQKFASGGLADFTGPAWLDGTKTNPEYVLNAAQTERFFTLVDILEGLKVAPANSTQNNRENNFDIDINVESINSDYDVEQVAIKVKDFIVNSSRYRNNNTL